MIDANVKNMEFLRFTLKTDYTERRGGRWYAKKAVQENEKSAKYDINSDWTKK